MELENFPNYLILHAYNKPKYLYGYISSLEFMI